jgi:steroid 5-alpha reductase family enzyme
MFTLTEIFQTISLGVLAYMCVWFCVALTLKRRDVVDSAWGLGFVLVAWMTFALRNNDSWTTTAAVLLTTLWGIRLFLHVTTRNWKKKEDYRYTQLGDLGTVKLWARTFTNVFLLQGVLMILISLPVIAIMSAEKAPIYWFAAVGAVVWLFGIIFEAVGDYQLREFLKTKAKGQIMQSGLWRYSRHPNYFGEVTAWWGAAIVALSYGQLWGLIGAATITILILKVSGIPLLEQRYVKDKAFQAYAKRTSIFIPLPPKGNA